MPKVPEALENRLIDLKNSSEIKKELEAKTAYKETEEEFQVFDRLMKRITIRWKNRNMNAAEIRALNAWVEALNSVTDEFGDQFYGKMATRESASLKMEFKLK